METLNLNQTKTKTMFEKKGGKVTNKVNKGFAIAKPSRGTIIEVNAIGKCICLGKSVEIVVVSSVYSCITKTYKVGTILFLECEALANNVGTILFLECEALANNVNCWVIIIEIT